MPLGGVDCEWIALDLFGGAQVWRRWASGLVPGGLACGHLVAGGEREGSEAFEIRLIDPGSGADRRTFEIPWPASSRGGFDFCAVELDERRFVACIESAGHTVVVVDVERGVVAGPLHRPGSFGWSTVRSWISVVHGTILLGVGSEDIEGTEAFDASLELLWTSPAAVAGVANGEVLLSCDGSRLQRVSPSTGAVVAETRLESDGSLHWSSPEMLVLALWRSGSGTTALVALDRRTLAPKWRLPSDGSWSRIFATEDALLVSWKDHGAISTHDPERGTELSRVDVSGPWGRGLTDEVLAGGRIALVVNTVRAYSCVVVIAGE
jgi:hypothetical protein